jgi:hypothetical protein
LRRITAKHINKKIDSKPNNMMLTSKIIWRSFMGGVFKSIMFIVVVTPTQLINSFFITAPTVTSTLATKKQREQIAYRC